MSVQDPEIHVVASAPSPSPAHEQGMPRRMLSPPVRVALAGVSGIALVGASFTLARANVGLDAARLLLWAAIAAIAGPALVRMLSPAAGRSERILLVALTALLLYWIKVLHDPVRLFLPDEFFHFANAQRIQETGALYGENLLLPVSADYPALPLVTAALSELTGLALFPCALLIIGLAKVALMVALFLVFERVSGSARIAGVGALLYCAQSNYVFWSAQFSYESLSLPLLVIGLLCIVARTGASRAQRLSWTVLGCLIVTAIALTHHLTSYAMVVILWASVVPALLTRRPDLRPPIAMATVATVASIGWVTNIATGTGGYLGTIFRRLLAVVEQATSTAGGTRAPFQGAPGHVEAVGPPIDDRLLAAGSVLLVALAAVVGVLIARRRTWRDPMAALFALGALAGVAAYSLRAFPLSWEIANRTSDFLYLGVALMAAVAALAFVDRGRRRGRIAIVAAAGVVAIAGGVVIGWPGTARLPRPFIADVGGGRVQAQEPLFAEWARAHLDRDSAIVANDTNGRLLSVAGFDRVWAGPTPGVRPLLVFDVIPQWLWDWLREHRIDYVVADRRVASTDAQIGYFYARPFETDDPLISNWLNVRRKFEGLPASSRIFDSGDVVVYDLRRARDRKEPPPLG